MEPALPYHHPLPDVGRAVAALVSKQARVRPVLVGDPRGSPGLALVPRAARWWGLGRSRLGQLLAIPGSHAIPVTVAAAAAAVSVSVSVVVVVVIQRLAAGPGRRIAAAAAAALVVVDGAEQEVVE